jgi:hypothetical protein
MANSSTSKYLMQHARAAAKKLSVSAKWAGSGRPVDIADDFIYEMYVLLRLIDDLIKTYKVVYDPGVGKHMYCFPYKPSNKRGRPRFLIHDSTNNTLIYQICAGTKISDIHNKQRSPDISFQKGNSPENPSYKDVVMLWDAKFRARNGRISHPELSEFGRWVELFKLRDTKTFSVTLDQLKDMVGNCLITNGKHSTEPPEECVRLNMKEVCSFFPGMTKKVKP